MFAFSLEAKIPLLTATRTGFWALDTVISYEKALRLELAKLHLYGQPSSFIIDIRPSGPQAREVANALRSMVARLGMLRADYMAVVTASGLAKLQALRVGDANAEVFTSMVLARDWVMTKSYPVRPSSDVHNKPRHAEAVSHLLARLT